MKIGVASVTAELDEKNVAVFFNWLYGEIDKNVKKDCYLIQYAYWLIETWFKELEGTFGLIVDERAGQKTLALNSKERRDIGRFIRTPLFVPAHVRILEKLVNTYDSSLEASERRELDTFIHRFSIFNKYAAGEKNKWLKNIADTGTLEVSAGEINDWLTGLREVLDELNSAAIPLENRMRCDKNAFSIVAQDMLKKVRDPSNPLWQRIIHSFQKSPPP